MKINTSAAPYPLTLVIPTVGDYQHTDINVGIADLDSDTYTLTVLDTRQYAHCNMQGIVQSISETPGVDAIPIPFVLNRHISLGWHYDDDAETFLPPNVVDYLDSQRALALQQIADRQAEMLTAATGGATAAERDTWIVKEAAARDVIAGGTGGGALRPVGGETLEQLAHKILVKAQGYKMLVGITDEIKRTAEKAVEAMSLETVDDLTALDAVLETANQQAMTALQQVTQ